MDQLTKKGKDAPSLPWQRWDVPIFKQECLVGVKRRTRWLLPNKPNSAYWVLVVDDMKENADIYADLLKEVGYQVWTVYDGKEGLRVAKSLQPDLILLNYLMPGLNGLEVLRQLRRDPETAHIKVIIDSALPIKDDALQAGAQAYIWLLHIPAELCGVVFRVLRS